MLKWIVKQYINGGTDWYDRAAFDSEWEARQWRATQPDWNDLSIEEARFEQLA
jgi:hypothetical protein